MNLSKPWEIMTGVTGVLQSKGSQRVRYDLATGQQIHKQYFENKLTKISC